MVTIELQVEGKGRIPKGAPISVQIRDTSLQDAPAEVLAETRGRVGESRGEIVAAFTLRLERFARDTTVWAHIDVDRDGRVSRGDFLTTQSYPVPRTPNPTVRVTLQQV